MPNVSTSSCKLDVSDADLNVPKETTGNRVIDLNLLETFVSQMSCSESECGMNGQIFLRNEYRLGLFSKLTFVCQACEKTFILNSCDKTKSGYSSNVRFVMGIYGVYTWRLYRVWT